MYGRALHCKRNILWRLLAGLLFIAVFPFFSAFPVRVAASVMDPTTSAAPVAPVAPVASAAPVAPVAPATLATMEGIDVMLLIDTSGSMRYSDSRRVALESARMFVDLLETNSSRIGVIGFSDKLQGVIPLTPIQHPEDKEHIKNTISSFIYNGYTDIGLALMEASRVMTADTHTAQIDQTDLVDPTDPVDPINQTDPIDQTGRTANSPMIVLLTDGFIQIDTPRTGRTVEISHNDVLAALELLGGHVPVYTIGLDNEESVDTVLLQTISDATGARSYIAQEAAELSQIYNEIIAEHLRSSLTEVADFTADGRNYTEVPFSVSSPYVSEADIIMFSSRNLTDVTLQNPTGEVVPFDGVRCTLAASRQYSIIKIAAPEEGEWLVGVKGANNDPIKVNVMYSYNMGISLSMSQDDGSGPPFHSSRPVFVRAEFMAANRQVQEDVSVADGANSNRPDTDRLYADIEAELHVYDTDMTLRTAIPMTRTENGFGSHYQTDEQEDLYFAVRATHTHFTKSSPLYSIRFEALPESATSGETTDDGATSSGASGDTTHDGSSDTSTAAGDTSAPDTETSMSTTPSSPSTTDKLPGRGFFSIPWRVLGLLLGGLAFIVLLFLVGKSAVAAIRNTMAQTGFNGYLAVRAMTQDGVYTVLETPDLRDFKGTVALDDFLSAQLSGNGAKILLVPVDLDGILLTPGQKNNRPVLLLSNKSGCEISDDEDNILTQKKIVWPESKRLTFSDVNTETFAKIEITLEGAERYG